MPAPSGLPVSCDGLRPCWAVIVVFWKVEYLVDQLDIWQIFVFLRDSIAANRLFPLQ